MKNHKLHLFVSLLSTMILSGCSLIFGNSSNTNTSPTTSLTTSIENETIVKSIEISPNSLAIAKGESTTLEAKVYPETALNKEVVWSSSKRSVATISDDGVLKAIGTGSCVITVRSAENTKIKATCSITVENQVIKPTSVILDKNSLQMNLNTKKTAQLSAIMLPSNASGSVVFKSFDNTIAVVDSSGTVTAKGYGETTIRAYASSDANVFADCAIEVERIQVESVSLEKHSLNVGTGSTPVLTATVLPSDADDKSLTWSSNDESIATVDSGVIHALKAGEVTITATSNDRPTKFDSCVITIHDIAAKGLALEPTSLFIAIDSSSIINPIFTPSDTTNKGIIWSSENESIATVIDGVVYGHSIGVTKVNAKSVDGGFEASCVVNVTTVGKTKLDYDCEDLSDYSIYQIDSLPSSGTCKILVVPVWFNDSGNYLNAANKNKVKDDINKAYFGTNEETGWRSVKTYYEEESFNKITIDGVVTDWYECGYRSSAVGSEQVTTQIVKNVASYYRTTHPEEYPSFDSNGDGYLDALVLIYAAPDYNASHSTNHNLWAYCYWVQEEPGTPSNPVPNVFFWASYDFMYSTSDSVGIYAGGDTSYCNIDTHTFIHEAGHMFGLDDYYDYNNGYSASGGFSMQDYNVGAHDPMSKMVLGWVDPYVIKDSVTLEIKPLESQGDVILLSPNFQNSPFDEYILIDLYTPTGLNEFDSIHHYSSSYPQGPLNSGCRIWHVDNRLAKAILGYKNSYKLCESPIFEEGELYTNAFTNSSFVTAGDGRCSILASTATDPAANFRQLQLIRKDYLIDYKCGDYLDSSDLFVTGDVFDMDTYSRCFYNNGRLNNGSELGFSVSFDSVSSTGARITITKE